MAEHRKPTVSEIRADFESFDKWFVSTAGIAFRGSFRERAFVDHVRTNIPHLLALVERMGKAFETAPDPARGTCLSEYCDWYEEARELLKEISL